MILESGPQGTTYKARFPNGLVGAVKRVKSHQLQNDSFLKSVQLLGRLHHHLVKLNGLSKGKDGFLVFDYMENGRLKDYLHDPLKTPLNWRTRLQIAIDIAAALEYLQYFCEPPIYNVSISSNNIFLDENFVAKILLSKEIGDLFFQFGMLLLELITGQSLLNEAEIVHQIQESEFAYSIHKIVDTDPGDHRTWKFTCYGKIVHQG
ncbi:hypothetical protein ZIOFF_045230 [Zingiber officinale]|uniref:Protein kinase domain-containing protein n=1 Tax=Zingiber officinale TaxID=94328 RepID=A0A8J5G015_ZINOF|nr:hypothetical protein ZIOFF_045230 [Zingiber officinale]